MKMLKVDVSEEIKIYNIYIQRIEKEGELFWSRFNIFWAINLALMTAVSYVIFTFYFSDTLKLPIIYVKFSLIVLSFLGVFFSIIWFLIMVNGRKWIFFMNDTLKDVEDTIFENKKGALYYNIVTNYSKSIERIKTWKISDLIDINFLTEFDVLDLSCTFSYIFIIIWSLALFFSVIFIFY